MELLRARRDDMAPPRTPETVPVPVRAEPARDAGLLDAVRCRPKTPVAFVLAGGGSLGASQVGMLAAVLESGVRPDLLVGCSVGALNAAFLAVDPTPQRATELAEVWRKVTKSDVFVGSKRSQLSHLIRGDAHILEASALRNLISRWLPYQDLSEFAVPLEVVTTDLVTGRPRWWSAGPTVDVLAASAALPALFPPVPLDGGLHVDGGVLVPTPTRRALELGAGITYVFELSGGDRHINPDVPMKALDVLLTSFSIARRAALGDPATAACPHQTIVQVPPPHLHGADIRDFSKISAWIDAGRRSVDAWLETAELPDQRSGWRTRGCAR